MNAEASLIELLAHAALKGTVVLGIALLLGLLLRRAAAARRYAVWMAAITMLGILPLALLVLPAWRVLPQAQLAPPPAAEQPVPEVPMAEAVPSVPMAEPAPAQVVAPVPAALPPVVFPAETSPPPFHLTWDAIIALLPGLWLAITGLLLLRLAWGARCLHRLEKTLAPGTSDLLHETAREMGLKRAPRLLIGAENAVPMVWGVWRPRLLLPRGFESWSREKLRGVLLHELAHLKRRDPLALWTAQWVKALHWFNPLAWLTLRQLRADQERACDDTVLRHGVRPSDYAQHLLDLSRHARLAPGLALCALTITRCAPVESRVKAILDSRRSREGLTPRWLLGLSGSATVITFAVATLHAAVDGPKLRGRILDRHGIVLAETTAEKARHYPLKTLASHLTGYTGKTKPEEAEPAGRSGLEMQQDAVLSQGKDVSLALDMRVQTVVTRAMLEAGITRGVAVVLDPRSGDVLAAVSLPAYDPNLFVPALSKEHWQAYFDDKEMPLLDRCFVRPYAPAAAFMPFTALAVLSTQDGNPTHVCNSTTTYGGINFRCLQITGDPAKHGPLDMPGALLASCHCYWSQAGTGAGIDPFEKLSALLGFDKGYGIYPREGVATLSIRNLGTRRPRPWTNLDVANLSLGQGFVQLTPLHLSVLAATIANGGKAPRPRLVREEPNAAWLADLASMGVTTDEVHHIREGMRLVVNGDGAGRTAKSTKTVIAAKTGVAPWGLGDQQNMALMMGFAPYDSPQLAFAVICEGKPGQPMTDGQPCGPIVKRIVEETLALPADGSGDIQPVAAAAWHQAGKQLLREIDRQRAGLGSGLAIQNFQVGKGQITFVGEAASMSQALRVKDLLGERSGQPQMEWSFPVPQAKEDGRVTFRAVGTFQSADFPAGAVLPPTGANAAFAGEAESVTLRPADADRWQLLKKHGGLAPLPAGSKIPVLSAREKEHNTGSNQFQFSTQREAAHRWLVDCLTVELQHEYSLLLQWPAPPEAFRLTYELANGCRVTIHCADGENVHVTVSKDKRPPMIAPDEATPPQPKTAAPRELDGVVDAETAGAASPWLPRFAENDTALELLLVESGQLLPAPIEPERVRNVLMRTNLFQKQPPVLNISAPIRLPKAPLFPGKRFQQSLLVALPDGQ